MSGENRFSPYRGILTEHVTTNRRVDYFLHHLHEAYVAAAPGITAQQKFQTESLNGILPVAAFSNATFKNTLKGGDLADGLENSLSFEALMFFSDVSAHLNKVRDNQEPNASVFKAAVDNVLALGENRDINNPVSKAVLLKVISLVLGNPLTNNKGNSLPVQEVNDRHGHTLRSFKGKVTGTPSVKAKDELAESFAKLTVAGFNKGVDINAQLNGADVTRANLPQVSTFDSQEKVGLASPDQYIVGGQKLAAANSGYLILANNLANAQKTHMCGVGSTLFKVNNGTIETDMTNRTRAHECGGGAATPFIGLVPNPEALQSSINDANLISKMRISDTHSALYWEHRGLMEYSSLVEGKIGCDLKKHFVATIALAGGKRIHEAGKTAEIAYHPIKTTTNEFPSAITHITSAHFEGGHAKSCLQWTSAMAPSQQIYLVMVKSTNAQGLDDVKTASEAKWKAEGGGLLPVGSTAWGNNVNKTFQKKGIYNRAVGTNYPAEFQVPINFETLAANPTAVKNSLTALTQVVDFTHLPLANNAKLDATLSELNNFYNSKKSVTRSYSTTNCDKESTIKMFHYNIDMVISHLMRNGSVLPISGDVDDSDDYEPREWNMQNGEYVDENGVVATIKGYTDAGKYTAANNCYTLGAAPANDGPTCEKFMLNCLAGEKVAECKNFLQRSDFWEITIDEVDAMIPEMGDKILERFGFNKNDGKWESPSSWRTGLTSNTSMGGLTPAEAASIGGNVQLMGWLSMVVDKTNSMPGTVAANTSLAGQWLVRKVGLPIKSSGVNGQVVSIDSLVHHILNRRRALAVHLLSPSVPVYGMIGGGNGQNNWELLAHNARKEIYDSVGHLESIFNGLREKIKAHGKEISPADLQEIKGEFKKQRAATDKLIKYIKYMEKYAVLKELYAVNDTSGKVLSKEGMQMLVNKNKDKFNKFTNAEDNTIQILKNMRSELDRLLN